MIIDKHEIPYELILNYCRTIKIIETGGQSIEIGNTSVETIRKFLHTRIFETANCNMSLFRREDRQFNLALNNTVTGLLDYLGDSI